MNTPTQREITKPNFLRLLAAIVLVTMLAVPTIFAASQTWTNAPTDNTWTNVLNWNGRAVPGAINSATSTDVASFTNALPISGIGGVSNPIIYDNNRSVSGMVFDTANCGAYQFGAIDGTNDASILYFVNNGNVTVNPAATNPQRFAGVVRVKLPSSTNGRYDFTNNATSPSASLFFGSIFNESANTRPLNLILAGTNTGTNTIAQILDGTTAGVNGAIQLDVNGTGKWIFSGANDLPQKTSASQVARLAVNAGTLEVKDPGSLGLITAANLSVQTGGTLQIDGVTLNNAGITLRSGGTIRMNGSGTVNGIIVGNAAATSVTLATTSAGDVMTVSAGTITPSGGAADTILHVAGPGTILLNQSATYIGRWTVDTGTNKVAVQGALGTGANLNIAAGAVFDVTPIGANTYTLDTKALSANGSGTAVGSTAATILADPAGTVDFASKPLTLAFAPVTFTGDSGHPSLFAAQGTLSFHGNSITVSNASGTALGAGTYQLVRQATGNILSSGGFVALVTGSGLQPGNIAEIVASGGDLNLVVSAYTPKNLVWKGGDISNPNAWDRQTSVNWLAGATPSTFNIYDSVVFNATGSAQPNVNLVATMAPSSVTVDTAANDYTFSGVGQIAGGTSLVKISPGALILQTANTYSGGTIISNGTVRLGIDEGVSSTGAGDFALYAPAVFDLNNFSNTVNAFNGTGTVDITGGGTSTLVVGANGNSGLFSGVIRNTSGTLGLFKAGTGSETLTASNSYVGPTVVDVGTLRVTNTYALGAGVSPVTINSGSLIMDTSLIISNLNGGGTVVNTAATTNLLTVLGGGTYGGVISGKIGILISGGTLRLNAANGISNATIVASGAGLAFGNVGQVGPSGVIASNGATLSMPTGNAPSPAVAATITTVDNAIATFTSASTASSWSGQFVGNTNATDVFSGGNVSIGGNYSFSNFLGTVVFTNGGIRWFTAVNGGDNTSFILTNGGGCQTRDNTIVRLGALSGNGNITGPSVSFPGNYWIGAKGIDCEFSGIISGSNNIVKVGAAKLVLDGAVITVLSTDSATYTNYLYAPAITYLNNTTVSNGVLSLSVPNDLVNSPVITMATSSAVLDASNMGYVTNFNDINSNPTSALVTNGVLQLVATTPVNGTPQVLAGFGTIKGNGVVSSGTINPGSAAAGGTLSISNGLTINAGATNYFDLSDDLTGVVKPSDLIKVQGNVTLSGNSIIGIGALNGILKVGTYPLIKYTGSLINEGGVVPSGPISNFALGGAVPATTRATMLISNAPGEVDLVVVSLNNLNLTWTGDGLSNIWDVVNSFTFTNTTGTSQFYQLDNVTFDNTSNPTNNSVLLAGSLAPLGLTINSTTNFIFGGTGNIQGSVTLIKTGTGTLIMTNGANSYSGGTILSNGVLNVGSDSGNNQNDLALGTGPVTVNSPAELRFGGNTGAVVNHFVTNSIIVNGGIVKVQDGVQHLTNSTVSLTVNGGTFQTVFATKNLVLDSPVTGTGNLTISVPATFAGGNVIFGNPGNTLSGTVTIATNGILALAGFAGLSNSPTIDVQQGSILDVSARSNAAWSVVSGQTVKGNGTVRGKSVTTAAGSILAPGAASAIGALTVTNFGNTTNFAVLTLAGTTSVDISRAAAPNTDRIVNASGTNFFGGTLTVNNLGAALVAGDTFQLFTSATNFGVFAATTLPALTTGLAWSNSVTLNGKLTVIALVNTTPTNITSVVNGGKLELSWPVDHIGWRLQNQTNTIATGLGTNWVDVTGSTTVNSVTNVINPANGSVFYRMVYP